MKQLINDWKTIGLLCLLLGLAPFVPEPHLFGKLRWVAGGAVGMQAMDWLDLLWHGAPFLLLVRLGIVRLRAVRNATVNTTHEL